MSDVLSAVFDRKELKLLRKTLKTFYMFIFAFQSVKENSKSLDKRISNRSPTRKVKSRISRAEKQILEVENNEKNRSLTENKVSETQQVSLTICKMN